MKIISLYSSSRRSAVNETDLVYLLRDFVTAGTETVATQLCWAVVLLGNHPQILKRLQKELDGVVPRDRLPSIDDKAKLPYMEATILEIMRIRTVGPLGIPHLTLCETEVAGYTIPEDTMVRKLLLFHTMVCDYNFHSI